MGRDLPDNCVYCGRLVLGDRFGGDEEGVNFHTECEKVHKQLVANAEIASEQQRQARVSAIEQRLRDIAAGASGSNPDEFLCDTPVRDALGDDFERFQIATISTFTRSKETGMWCTFRQLAERIEASDGSV